MPSLQADGPVFAGVEEKFGGKIRLCRIDIDEQEELVSRFNLEGVPVFILFDGEKELGRIIGYRRKDLFLLILINF